MLDNATVRSATGVVAVNTPNPNTNGSGPMATLLTIPGDSVGAIVNSIVVKATGSTSPGMVRVFLRVGGGDYMLYEEFSIPATSPSSTLETYQATLVIPGGLTLAANDVVAVTTQNGDNFNVFGSYISWIY